MTPSREDLRQHIWRAMEDAGVARFPGAFGRIPNFAGAEQAASLAADLDVWSQARVLKCNPDLPQRPLRWRALRQGKAVYMAVPRLTSVQCFVELDPERLGKKAYAASSIRGAFQYGRLVTLEEMRPIDLMVCGSVAVTEEGARLGKGGGYSDLEFALVRHTGLIDDSTPIITTVHSMQIVGHIPMTAHDIPVNYIVTPHEALVCPSALPRPRGIYWDHLDEEKIAAVPVLQKLQREAGRTISSPQQDGL